MQCQTGSQKIEECQLTIEKTWLLAREEAAKRKAANEIIKALALRVILFKLWLVPFKC
jgi:hypothetical protein